MADPSPRKADAAAAWWNADWRFRRRIDVPILAQKSRDASAVWAKFHCSGAMNPDGSDLRVVSKSGKQMKCAVRGISPGDEALIVFEFEKGCEEYYAYYGNSKATAQQPYEPRCGLLLETRGRGPGDPNSWAEMQAIIKASTYVYGRGYRGKIHDGANPFGPSENYISIYTGYFIAPLSGVYTFCTASDDASFMFINGKMVCSWPGYHGAAAGLWGKFAGTINLDKGVHEIAYYHLQATETSACVAGWKQPGMEDKDVVLMPEGIFVPIFEGRDQPQEEVSQPLSADFSAAVTTDLVFEEGEFQLAKFTPRVMASGKITKYLWSFGDGCTSDTPAPTHVYLEPGIYEISLSVIDDKDRQASVKHRMQILFVLQPDAVSYIVDKQIELFAPFVKGYDPTKLKPSHIAALWAFYRRAGDDNGQKSLAQTLLSKLGELPSSSVAAVAEQVGDYYSEKLGKPHDALAAFDMLIKSSQKSVRAKGYIKTGDIWLFKLDDPTKAVEYYDKAVAELGKGRSMEQRFAYIRMGDAARYTGKFDEAMLWYKQAEDILLSGRTPRQTLTLRGAYAQTVESHMRNKRYDEAKEELDMWEWEFPTERLEGYSTYLRVKFLMAREQHLSAVKEGELLIKANPRSNYADKLLLLIADSHISLKDKTSALSALRRIVKDYPASPHVSEAKSRISALGATP